MAHRLLSLMHANDREQVILTGVPMRLQSDTLLATGGDRPRLLHFIVEGWACRYEKLSDGRRQIIDILLPGDICDIDWLHGHLACLPAIALTMMRTIGLKREEVEDLAEQDIRLARTLQADMHEKFVRRGQTICTLGRRSAIERLAYLLCGLFTRLRRAGLARGNLCDFPLTQGDLGDLAGLTPVHVNRVVQELRQRKMITLQRRRLMIPDFDLLADLGHFSPQQMSNESPISRLIGLGAELQRAALPQPPARSMPSASAGL